MINGPWLQTATGRAFPLTAFSPEDFDPQDLCMQLPRVIRYHGAAGLYSTAQHSLIVAAHLPPALQLEGLLHDGHEYITGDVPAPIQRLFPELVAWTDSVRRSFAIRFGLPEEVSREVVDADLRALITERRDLMRKPPQTWGSVERFTPFPEPVAILPEDEVATAFRKKFEELISRRARLAARSIGGVF